MKNYDSENSFRDRLCRLLFTIFTKKMESKISPPNSSPQKGVKKCYDRKRSCIDRLRSPLWTIFTKKSNKKISPPTFNPRKWVKNVVRKNSYRDRLCSPIKTIFTQQIKNSFFHRYFCHPFSRGSFHLQPIKKKRVIQTMYTFIFCEDLIFWNLKPRKVPLLVE